MAAVERGHWPNGSRAADRDRMRFAESMPLHEAVIDHKPMLDVIAQLADN